MRGEDIMTAARQKPEGEIKVEEFDVLARKGFHRVEKIFESDEMTEDDHKVACLSLKFAQVGTTRMSAITNRVAVSIKAAEFVGVPPEQTVEVLSDLLPKDYTDGRRRAKK